MIKINNLTKVYTTDEVETTALNSINIEIKDGEFVAPMFSTRVTDTVPSVLSNVVAISSRSVSQNESSNRNAAALPATSMMTWERA